MLFLGVIVGVLSSVLFYSFVPSIEKSFRGDDFFILSSGTFLPGTFFGVGLSILYILSGDMNDKRSILSILFLCTVSYFLAFHIAYQGFLFILYVLDALTDSGSNDALQRAAMVLSAAVAGFISTYIMMLWLTKLTKAYSKKMINRICLLGAVVAAALISFVFESFLGSLAFFVAWQSIMMVAVGLPLLKPKLNKTAVS